MWGLHWWWLVHWLSSSVSFLKSAAATKDIPKCSKHKRLMRLRKTRQKKTTLLIKARQQSMDYSNKVSITSRRHLWTISSKNNRLLKKRNWTHPLWMETIWTNPKQPKTSKVISKSVTQTWKTLRTRRLLIICWPLASMKIKKHSVFVTR